MDAFKAEMNLVLVNMAASHDRLWNESGEAWASNGETHIIFSRFFISILILGKDNAPITYVAMSPSSSPIDPWKDVFSSPASDPSTTFRLYDIVKATRKPSPSHNSLITIEYDLPQSTFTPAGLTNPNLHFGTTPPANQYVPFAGVKKSLPPTQQLFNRVNTSLPATQQLFNRVNTSLPATQQLFNRVNTSLPVTRTPNSSPYHQSGSPRHSQRDLAIEQKLEKDLEEARKQSI
jgi:hypothetical protein